MARKKSTEDLPQEPVTETETDGPVAGQDTGTRAKQLQVPKDEIPDAEIVAEPDLPQETELRAQSEQPAAEESASETQAEPETATLPERETPDAAERDASAETEREPSPTRADPAPTQAQTPPPEKSGFFPMLIGGVVAAGLGYGAHMLTQTEPAPSPQVTAEIAQLRAIIAAIPAPQNPSPAFDPSDLMAQIDDLRAQIAALPVESSAPVADGGADDDAIAALAEQSARIDALAQTMDAVRAEFDASIAELNSLRAQLDAGSAELGSLRAQIDEVRDIAEIRVRDAEAAIDLALARAGLDSLSAALITGTSFSAALGQIAQGGFDVPAALSARATTGIPTLEVLQESFAPAARDGLRASLLDAPTESTLEKISNFLRAQVGAMSTAPRDGDDPDAILSRANAALIDGNLAAAMAELAPLPEAARSAMASWLGNAQARLDAEVALADLTAQINQ